MATRLSTLCAALPALPLNRANTLSSAPNIVMPTQSVPTPTGVIAHQKARTGRGGLLITMPLYNSHDEVILDSFPLDLEPFEGHHLDNLSIF